MNGSQNIPIGSSGTRSLVVTRDVTVAHADESMPAVFATPMMILLMEMTAGETIQHFLPAGWISVGVVVNVKHLAATPVGATVTAKAEVVAVGDNTVTFSVEAHDGVEKIGEGTHVRATVEMDRFLRRVERKRAMSANLEGEKN
jgi:fluoroacetyl-CoA thioesterase